MDNEREKRTREFLTNQSERAIALRSKEREFHGLEREFHYHQIQMIAGYERSKDIKHPRDVGSVREMILRRFLTTSGYLPKRYAVSENSVRVASTSGHISREIDILFYDPVDSIRLMSREDSYDVFPVESVYGVIQVKSRLNKREIAEGLSNLASFKSLDRSDGKSGRGFGILFSYDSDLEWLEIIREIELFAQNNPNRLWANYICVLTKGAFIHGDSTSAKIENPDLEQIKSVKIYGLPDRNRSCLFGFQSTVMQLLRHTKTAAAELDPYFRLPFTADRHSYSFIQGSFAEIGKCRRHGDYQRSISPEHLTELIEWCQSAEPIDYIRSTNLSYGLPDDEDAAYRQRYGNVIIYNPDALPLQDILTGETTLGGRRLRVDTYDAILVAGMRIHIPYFYSLRGGIISGCPKCK
ncbi:hypothetical protein HMI51_10305 [Corallococcus coralloides]|nr:hypothetical protein [Corallococcus coralloides]